MKQKEDEGCHWYWRENLGTCYVVGSLFQGKLMSECSQGEMATAGQEQLGAVTLSPGSRSY